MSLAWPVVHVWFRSVLAHLLGIPPRTFDDLVECKAFLVLTKGRSSFEKGQILPAREYFGYRAVCRDDTAFSAMTGGRLVKRLIAGLDMETCLRESNDETLNRRSGRRLALMRTLSSSGTDPAHTVLEVLPVLPPALTPVLAMEDGTIVTDDLNELYSRVVHRALCPSTSGRIARNG